LVADLRKSVKWADAQDLRWAFTNSNAGSLYFEDYTDLTYLDRLDWDAINADRWSGRQDSKQAEFLVERCFPWNLVEEIGVYSPPQLQYIKSNIANQHEFSVVNIRTEWYY
jgi:hypothetical protein